MQTPTQHDVLASLSEITDPAAREQLLVEAVQLGLHDLAYFSTITSTWGPHTATFVVTRLPLSIGRVFIPVTARAQLRIADALRCVLPTPKLLRLMHEQAPIQVTPYTRPTTDGMRSYAASLELSLTMNERITKAVAASGADEGALVGVFGKSWVVTRAGQDWLTKVPNMGLASPIDRSAKELAPTHWIQTPQHDPVNAHNAFHDDYSQLCYLVHGQCVVDGITRDITDVLKDPTLHRLLADDGPLHDFRPFELPIEPMDPPALPALPVIDWAMIEGTRVLPQNYNPTTRTPSRIVLHSAETDETRQVASKVAHWFANGPFPNGPASVHWIVDDAAIVAAVPEEQIAFGAKGANHDGIHIEIAGRANQGALGWNDAYSQAALLRAALVTARACKQWGIPARWLDAGSLGDPTEFGITTHANVSRGLKVSTHYDPGPAFPVVRFLRMVDAALAALA